MSKVQDENLRVIREVSSKIKALPSHKNRERSIEVLEFVKEVIEFDESNIIKLNKSINIYLPSIIDLIKNLDYLYSRGNETIDLVYKVETESLDNIELIYKELDELMNGRIDEIVKENRLRVGAIE